MVLNCSCLRSGPSENAVGTDNIMKHMKDERILIVVYMLNIGCVLIKKRIPRLVLPEKTPKTIGSKKVEPSFLMKRERGN